MRILTAAALICIVGCFQNSSPKHVSSASVAETMPASDDPSIESKHIRSETPVVPAASSSSSDPNDAVDDIPMREIGGIYVLGDSLTESDIDDIKNAVQDSAEIEEKRIISIELVAPNKVKVTTGVIRGPLDGGGEFIELEKMDGQWEEGRVGIWMS